MIHGDSENLSRVTSDLIPGFCRDRESEKPGPNFGSAYLSYWSISEMGFELPESVFHAFPVPRAGFVIFQTTFEFRADLFSERGKGDRRFIKVV